MYLFIWSKNNILKFLGEYGNFDDKFPPLPFLEYFEKYREFFIDLVP